MSLFVTASSSGKSMTDGLGWVDGRVLGDRQGEGLCGGEVSRGLF